MGQQSLSALSAHPRPRRLSTRGIIVAIVSMLIFVIAYVLVVWAYQVEGDLTVTSSSAVDQPDVLSMAEPVEFDARTNTLTMRFQFLMSNADLLDDGNRLNQGVRVTIFANDGTHEVRFAKGEPIGYAEVAVGTSGEVSAYPLDSHTGFTSMLVETFERGAGGVNETTGTLTSSLDVNGSVSGWDINASITEEDGVPIALIDLNRAFSTKAFAVVLLGMAISVAVLAFIAALLTVTNRRRFEVALLTWNGAILFALPLLRNYLPGSPPIGAAIDIYLYLWVFVFAVISLVLMLIAWSEQRKGDLLEEHAKLGDR